jgi:hypothetical protein
VDVFARRAEMPTFGRAFLLMAMHRSDPQRPEVQTLTHELLGNLEELPATAHTIERVTWDWGPYFHSDGRSDAIVLLALLRARPESAVIEKLAASGATPRRTPTRWSPSPSTRASARPCRRTSSAARGSGANLSSRPASSAAS